MYQLKEGSKLMIRWYAESMAGMNCMITTLIGFGMLTKGIETLRSVCYRRLLGKKPMPIEMIKL
jgi:hypothetical protein